MCLVAGRLDWIFFELLVESFLLWKKEDQSPYLADHQDCERGLIRSSWYGHVSDPCVDSLLLIVVHRGRGWKFPLGFWIASIVSWSLYLSATVWVWIYQSELLCVYTLYIWFGNWASNLAARFHCVTTRLFLILNQGPAVLLVLDPRNIPIGRWFWLIVWLIIIRLLTSTEIRFSP